MHTEKVPVWCALWSVGVNGLYFYGNANSERYRSMVSAYFCKEVDDYKLKDKWFQQDTATSHTILSNRALMQEKFLERVISRLSVAN